MEGKMWYSASNVHGCAHGKNGKDETASLRTRVCDCLQGPHPECGTIDAVNVGRPLLGSAHIFLAEGEETNVGTHYSDK